jgi:peptidoglycan hydrolase-like protein with peptidoglycan-binding domain
MNLRKSKTAKLFAGALGLGMALSFALPAGAQTTAELTAQINSLLAMIAQLQAQIAGQGGQVPLGSVPQGSAVLFNTDLTIGSTGSDVTALQQWLVARGYLQMPAGVAYGYFGPITQSAVARYQAEAGISPAAGYFGPITRARLNAMATQPGTVPGTTPGTTPGTGITTPGVEGTLTVSSSNSGLISTLYEGDSMAPILGVKVEAKNSDIAVQRIKLELGTNTEIYNKVYSRLYVTDGSNTLASVDLNSSTVVKEGSSYYITITGFNLVVPRNGSRTIVIKADARNTFDSTDITNINASSARGRVQLAANGIRGIDGAGIDQYAGGSSDGAVASRTVTLSKGLSENATLKLSLNNSSPKKQDVVAASGATENELDKLSVLVFDVKAEKDDVTITDLQIGIAKTGTGNATASSTVYLYDGSTEIDSASVSGGNTAIFSDVDLTVSKDTTKTLTVKVDIRNANGTAANFVASASSTGITAENSKGDSATVSGSATGNSIGIRDVGAEVTLVSKNITTAGAPQGGSANTLSTSTLTATFNVKIKAVGGDIVLGDVGSTSANRVFTATGATNSFGLYANGVMSSVSGSGAVATSTSFTIPSVCTPISGTNSCTLAEGNEVTIPVTFVTYGRTAAGVAHTSGLYSVGLQSINWSSNNGATISSSTFMAGETDWRTADVSFP